MSDDMIELVARAIAAQTIRDTLNKEPPARDIDLLWPGTVAKARAAIQAMRQPTEAMVEAAAADLGQDAEEYWKAMIDAALADERIEGAT